MAAFTSTTACAPPTPRSRCLLPHISCTVHIVLFTCIPDIFYNTIKSIFHRNANPFALGLNVGYGPQCERFTLPIPTYWYPKSLADPMRSLTDPTQSLMDPTQAPTLASGIYFVLGMRGLGLHWISSCLCIFSLCWVANTNAFSGEILSINHHNTGQYMSENDIPPDHYFILHWRP